MKDDANLICPLSYEDPFSLWQILNLQRDLTDLRDVTWKSPISSTYITIDKLPLRFLRSDANLFKDTEHSFRWFLAAYVSIYLITADSLDAYKTAKVPLKKWIDQNASHHKRTPWLVIYCPTATRNVPIDIYNKIYSRLSSEFYGDRPGDRSVMLITKPDASLQAQNKPKESRLLSSPDSSFSSSLMLSISSFSTSAMSVSSQGVGDVQLALTSFQELLSKLREGVVQSFQYRTAAYDADIRRLDAARSSAANHDFRQLFLVKESLALMYQMMQLADKALVQYEELEDLIHSYSVNSTLHNNHSNSHNSSNGDKSHKVSHFQLPDTDWPMIAPELLSTADLPSTSKIASKTQADVATFSSPPVVPTTNPAGTEDKEKDKDKDKDAKGDSSKNLMSDACKNGDDVLSYSINVARLKILKNKMSALELLRYIFARQMHLLGQLERPVACAEKSVRFMQFSFTYIMKRLDEKYFATDKLTGRLLHQSPAPMSTSNNPPDAASYELRTAQCQLWSLSASVRLLKVCRELILRLYRDGADRGLRDSGVGQDGTSLYVPSSSFSSSSSAVTSAIISAAESEQMSKHNNASSLAVAPPTSSRSSDDAVFLVHQFGNLPQPLKDSSAALSELLSFAMLCLHKLCPTLLSNSRRISSDFTIPSTQSQSTRGGLRINVTKSGVTAECVEPKSSVADEGIQQIRSNEFRLFLDHDLYVSGLGSHIVNMDQVISFASHKVRSLSHFWAKLMLSSGSSLYKSAADFPLDPGYISSAGIDGAFLIPMMNVEGDNIGKISLSRYDKGRALELSLAILLTSIQAEMMTWADRPRSTAGKQVTVCDYLLSGGLYGRVLSLYERGGLGLMEQIAEREYISLDLPIMVKFSRPTVDEAIPISIQSNFPIFCLPFLRLANVGGVDNGLLAGGFGFCWWAELCFSQLTKLLFCARQLQAWDTFRQISAFLLTTIDDVPLRSNKEKVKSFLFDQLLSPMEVASNNVDLSSLYRILAKPSSKSTEIVQFPNSVAELLTSFQESFTLLVLHLRKYFSFEIRTNVENISDQSALNSSSGSPSVCRLRLAAGKVKLARLEEQQEDDAEHSNDVRAFRFAAGESKSYGLFLSLVSLMPLPFAANDITITYSNLLNLQFDGDLTTQLPDITIRACQTNAHAVMIRPGPQQIPLSFTPELAGDYYLNRMTICSGTQCFVFQQQLPELSSAYEKEGTTQDDASPTYIFADSSGQHRARGLGFSNYSFLHRLGSYPFLRIHSSPNPLNLRGLYPTLSPLEGVDCMLLCLDTQDEDAISDLTVDVFVQAKPSTTLSSSIQQEEDIIDSHIRYQQLAMRTTDPLEDDAKRMNSNTFHSVQTSNRYLSPAVREKFEASRLKEEARRKSVKFTCGELQVRYSSPEVSLDETVPVLSLPPQDLASPSAYDSNLEHVSQFRYAVSNLLSGRTAHLNLQFQTFKNCDQNDQDDGDKDGDDDDDSDEKMQFTVLMTITGLLQRSGCVYRFQQTCSCEIVCFQSVEVAVVNADIMDDGAQDNKGHFLQSVVHNKSGKQIRLVGYAFHPHATRDSTGCPPSLVVSEGPPSIQNMSHLSISDLLRSTNGIANITAEEGVMLSEARDEDYFAAFLVHESAPPSPTSDASRLVWELSVLYEFCDDQEQVKKLSAARRLFQAKTSLCIPGAVVHRSQEDDIIQIDFLSLLILPAKAASSSDITRLNVTVGASIFLSYTLRLRVRQSPSLLHGQEEPDDCRRMIVTATVCQSSSLVVVGHYRYSLTDSIKRQITTSSPTSSRCNDVEVSLKLCLLPARAGLVQLPPLRIQAYYQHGSGRKGKEISFLCHPNLVGRGLHSLCAVGETFDFKVKVLRMSFFYCSTSVR